MERVIDCPVCYDVDACFEEMQKEFNSYMCFNCGFMSSSVYTEENIHQVENTAKLVEELKFFDEERQIYWYPSVVNMGPKGIIFPEGNPEYWVWRYVQVVSVPEEEQKDYPIPGEEDKFYTEKLDLDNAKTYGQYEFMNACKDMGIAVEKPNA